MRRLFWIGLLAAPLWAQQPVSQAPDCSVPFFFSQSTGTSASFDNRYQGCSNWTLVYSASNASVVSIGMNSASDNNGVPGAFAPFGSVLTNAAFSNVTVPGYVPWLNVTGSFTFGVSPAGFVQGTVIGWRPGPDSGGGGGGGSTVNNCATNYTADPSGQIDSTAALQACIDSMAPGGANDGASVAIPPSISPNFFYLCTGQLNWDSVIHGKIILQTGAALQGCALPPSNLGTWVVDETTPSVTIWGTLSLPNVTSAAYQTYQVCNPATFSCSAIFNTSPLGMQVSPVGLWGTSVATIPGTYSAGQTAAIGSSGSPILLYTTPATPSVQNYTFCHSVTAISTAADPGAAQLVLAWTDIAVHAQTFSGPTVNLGTNGVNGSQCINITPRAATNINFYTTYTASGTSIYGASGTLRPQ